MLDPNEEIDPWEGLCPWSDDCDGFAHNYPEPVRMAEWDRDPETENVTYE